MSNLQLDPTFVRYILGIYGNADLDGRTIKNLYQTWKTNPEIIKNTFRNKPIELTRTSLAQKVTPGTIDKSIFLLAMPARDDLSQFKLEDAAKIAHANKWDTFVWNNPDSRLNPDGLVGTKEGMAAERAIRQDRINNLNTVLPTTRVQQTNSNNYWNSVATKYGFKDMQEVRDWQSKNGLIADGKFGKNSLAKWNTLQSTPTSAKPSNKKLKPTIEIGVPKVIGVQLVLQPVLNTKSQPTTKPQSKSNLNNSNKSTNSVLPTISRYTMNNTVGGDFGINRLLRNAASNIGDFLVNMWNTRESSARPLTMGYGHTTAYLQGGKLEDGQKAFVAYLIQVSGAQSEQELNDFIQSLGEEGLKQQYLQFIQIMQNGTQSAKNGAKLNYIKSLRGICPEGYELGYFKEGGLICAKCVEKREKMGGIPFTPILGEKGTKVVQDFKKDLKNKKDKIKMSKKNPEKKENGGTLNINLEMLDIFRCGGKSKKKEKGGLVEKKVGIPIKEKYIDKDKCGKKMKKKK